MPNQETTILKQERAIEELKMRVKNKLTPALAKDPTLHYRFLKARDFDVDRAEKMLLKNILWRKINQIDTLLEDFTPDEFFTQYPEPSVLGYDKEGNIVRYTPAGSFNPLEIFKATKMSNFMKHWFWFVESSEKLLKAENERTGKNAYQAVIILNLEKLTFSVAASKTNGYQEELCRIIDPDVLPAFLGGNRTDPDGNPLCKTFIRHDGSIPERYYMTPEERYFKDRSKVQSMTIPAGQKREIHKIVKELGTKLEWDFLLESKDIGFGLFLEDSEHEVKDIIPVKRYRTPDGSHSNAHKCRETGKYIFVFDNTYSWRTYKNIEYCITLVLPNQ